MDTRGQQSRHPGPKAKAAQVCSLPRPSFNKVAPRDWLHMSSPRFGSGPGPGTPIPCQDLFGTPFPEACGCEASALSPSALVPDSGTRERHGPWPVSWNSTARMGEAACTACRALLPPPRGIWCFLWKRDPPPRSRCAGRCLFPTLPPPPQPSAHPRRAPPNWNHLPHSSSSSQFGCHRQAFPTRSPDGTMSLQPKLTVSIEEHWGSDLMGAGSVTKPWGGESPRHLPGARRGGKRSGEELGEMPTKRVNLRFWCPRKQPQVVRGISRDAHAAVPGP